MKIHLIRFDITKLTVDAIVNAANSYLQSGGGVDGAIHRAGGKSIQDECNQIISKIKRLPAGEAVLTSAGNLKAKFIIHTVGPIWHGGNRNEPAILKNCYRNSLELAIRKSLKTIAFPNISTGVYAFPKVYAAKIVIEFIQETLEHKTSIEDIYFVCFDEENLNIYKNEFLTLGINYLTE